jgi:phenylalanyl-tRNA synthetase alpha chain
MTYRNDPYDPKQVALLDQSALDEAVAAARTAFADATDPDALAALRHHHLGDRAPVSLARREIGALPPAAKSDAGKRVNETRRCIESAFAERRAELDRIRAERALAEERVDVTLPHDRRPRGARHPLSTLMESVSDHFVGMGYEVAEGPELELEWAAFDALNIAPDHPARGLMDTFHTDVPGLVMRPHTSSVQARAMLTRTPPIYVVCPGRVYRTDYFPFTEPSAEFDVWFAEHRDGPRWVEWGGCGMVNPRVLRACGVDPEVYSGFAFGMGIERTLMLRHGIGNMRDIVEGDVRFTRAFGVGV